MSFVFLEATSDQLLSEIQFDHTWSVHLSKHCAMMKCKQLCLYLWISIRASMIILHTPKLVSFPAMDPWIWCSQFSCSWTMYWTHSYCYKGQNGHFHFIDHILPEITNALPSNANSELKSWC